MSIIYSHRAMLALPDGTIQALEWDPELAVGDLVAATDHRTAEEPTGKLVVTWVEDRRQDGGPFDRFYHVRPF